MSYKKRFSFKLCTREIMHTRVLTEIYLKGLKKYVLQDIVIYKLTVDEVSSELETIISWNSKKKKVSAKRKTVKRSS